MMMMASKVSAMLGLSLTGSPNWGKKLLSLSALPKRKQPEFSLSKEHSLRKDEV